MRNMVDALMRFVLLSMVEPMVRISECFGRGLNIYRKVGKGLLVEAVLLSYNRECENA